MFILWNLAGAFFTLVALVLFFPLAFVTFGIWVIGDLIVLASRTNRAVCPACGGRQPPGRAVCRFCGHQFYVPYTTPGQPSAAVAAPQVERRAPAGWYPDPDGEEGMERWWNGREWADRHRNPSKHGTLIAVGIVAATVLLGLAMQLSGALE